MRQILLQPSPYSPHFPDGRSPSDDDFLVLTSALEGEQKWAALVFSGHCQRQNTIHKLWSQVCPFGKEKEIVMVD